jgi:transcription initiation factor TFIIIB Brf1 subunit/transcription initiation factor TFIIB
MNYDDIQRCKAFARRLDELEVVSENAPTSVAAGTLYYYSLKRSIDLNKKSIADACEVSEVTITKCLKRLNKQRELIDRAYAELI